MPITIKRTDREEKVQQKIMEVLHKIHVSDQIRCVEALPQALDKIHDVKGEGGLSPYEILFGRQRPLAGIPYQPPKECEDAREFFERMHQLDQKISDTLNMTHQKSSSRENSKRKLKASFSPGDKVWYRRPPGSGGKMDSRWLGPALVKIRIGAQSYTITIKPNSEITSHDSFFKLYQSDD